MPSLDAQPPAGRFVELTAVGSAAVAGRAEELHGNEHVGRAFLGG